MAAEGRAGAAHVRSSVSYQPSTPLAWRSMSWLSVTTLCAGAFCDAALALFFAMAVAMGFAYAAVDTYLFLRLKELGGDGYVMGTAAVVQIISELPCFWWRCDA